MFSMIFHQNKFVGASTFPSYVYKPKRMIGKGIEMILERFHLTLPLNGTFWNQVLYVWRVLESIDF